MHNTAKSDGVLATRSISLYPVCIKLSKLLNTCPGDSQSPINLVSKLTESANFEPWIFSGYNQVRNRCPRISKKKAENLRLVWSFQPEPTRFHLSTPDQDRLDLTRFNQIWPYLIWSYLTSPDLIWPFPIWSDLTWPDLTWSDLIWPNLTWSDLIWPNLTWSDLT